MLKKKKKPKSQKCGIWLEPTVLSITTITWTKKNDPSMQKAIPMNSSDRIRSFRLPNLSTTRTEMEVPVTWITPTTMAQMLASN